MIVAIDGTGPDSSDDYAREMGGSFCSQIGRAANAIYFRGPTLTGSEYRPLSRGVGKLRHQIVRWQPWRHGGRSLAGHQGRRRLRPGGGRMDEQAIRKPETDRDAQTVRPPPARPAGDQHSHRQWLNK
jgi:hypothetical protein